MFSSLQVHADHVVGGEVEYECIGPRIWKIRLTVYRDCNGAPICFSGNCKQTMIAKPNVALNPANCVAIPNEVIFNLPLVKVEDVGKASGELCGNIAKNGCTNLGQVTAGPFNPSTEKYIFEGTLDLSSPSLNNATCTYWDVYWDLCCRSQGIWNLAISYGQTFRIGATINIFNRSANPLKNNSPIIKNEPALIICSGQEYVFNMGAIDPDDDSLTYEITPSLQSSGSPVVYQPPGSANYPFPLNAFKAPHISHPQPNGPYIILDSSSGDISFNPSNNTSSFINGNINMQIKQWSKDSIGNPLLVGITQRELQFSVFNCPSNNPPRLATIPLGPNNKPIFEYEICAGDSLGFTVIAKDTDAYLSLQRFDTTYISWNEGIVRPGKLSFKPTYTIDSAVTRPREDSWQFNWKTEINDGRTLPYFFTVTAFDKFCPNVGRVTRSFKITVLPKLSFNTTKTNLRCGNTRINLYKNAPYGSLQTASLQVSVAPNDKNFIYGTRIVAPININPQGSQIDSITQPRLMYSDSFRYTQPGKYYLRFNYVASEKSCLTPVFDSIEIYPNAIVTSQIVSLGDTTFCDKESVSLLTKLTNPNYIYQWLRNDSIIANKTTSNLTAKLSGLYKLLVTDTALNCNTFSNTIRVDAHPRVIPKPSILVHYNCAFSLNNISYFDSSKVSSGTFTRLWGFGDSTTSTAQSGTKMYTTAKTYSVKLTLTSNFGCIDSAATIIPIMEPINLVISSNKSANICQGESVLLSCINYPNANYYWFKNNELLSNANSNILTVNQQGNYKLVIAMGPDCIDTSNTITVQVNPIPNVGFTINNTSQCLNTNRFILIDTTTIASGNYTKIWTWANNTSSLQNLNLSFTDTGLYYLQLKVTSIHGCSDSSSKKLTVLANSTIDSINGSINNLSNHQTYNYFVNQRPNNTYYWLAINGNIISGQGTNSVTVNYLQPGTGQLKAIATNTNGCSDTASITVNILSNPPYILNFNPKIGPNGTVVTINGGNFYGTSAVTFGGINAQKFTEVSPNVILAIVDSGATGDVVVVTSSGTDSLSLFTYVARNIITEIGSQWFSIFPNPASVEVSIESNLSLQYVTFELFDLNGKVVHHYKCNTVAKRVMLDIRDLIPSSYLLRIVSDGQSCIVKIIKQ